MNNSKNTESVCWLFLSILAGVNMPSLQKQWNVYARPERNNWTESNNVSNLHVMQYIWNLQCVENETRSVRLFEEKPLCATMKRSSASLRSYYKLSALSNRHYSLEHIQVQFSSTTRSTWTNTKDSGTINWEITLLKTAHQHRLRTHVGIKSWWSVQRQLVSVKSQAYKITPQ